MRRSGSLFTFSDISSSVSVGQLVASSSAVGADLTIPYSNRVLNTSSLYSYVQVKPNISHSHIPTWNQVIPSFDPNVLGSWGFGTMPSTNINQFIKIYADAKVYQPFNAFTVYLYRFAYP